MSNRESSASRLALARILPNAPSSTIAGMRLVSFMYCFSGSWPLLIEFATKLRQRLSTHQSGSQYSPAVSMRQQQADMQSRIGQRFLRSREDRRERLAHEVGEHVEAAAMRHRSEEHTSELQSLMRISYAVFCLKKKNKKHKIK